MGEHSAAAGDAANREGVPDPELIREGPAAAVRGRYTLRILREADARARLGEIGAPLRQEVLYDSNL